MPQILIQRTPDLVIGVDPDKTRTALAWAVKVAPRAYRLAGLVGGGSSKKAVAWSSIKGQLRTLEVLAYEHCVDVADLLVAIETQAAHSPWSTSVEALRRVRYHFDAATELLGCSIEHVDKGAWQNHSAPVAVRGKGSIKAACQKAAREALGFSVNGDQADAFGILRWTVEIQMEAKFIVEENCEKSLDRDLDLS